MTWENYFDSNRTFTVILYINAAIWIRSLMDTQEFMASLNCFDSGKENLTQMDVLESPNTVFTKMHNLSGSTCNMHCSVGMVTYAMFSLDMATSQGLPVSGRKLCYTCIFISYIVIEVIY
jgi:hypothetical protein